MNPGRRLVLMLPTAAVLATALLLLAVALVGEELSLSQAIRSCIQSGGVLLALGVFALVAGLVTVLLAIRSRSDLRQ